MNLKLRVWRQKSPSSKGRLELYEAKNVNPDMSILEMLDEVNEELIKKGEDPIAFESDCREGICGMCGMVVDGIPHGEQKKSTTCELRMRHFKDNQTITIEPFRAKGLPIIKDLTVDRSGLDRIIQAGGYISAYTGKHADANCLLIPKENQEYAMDAAQCIGCGACVAACPNGSAMLFVGAKVSHLSSMPQGKSESAKRVHSMIFRMQNEDFGNCSNHYECQEVCPKDIDVKFIAKLNREYFKSLLSLFK